MTSAVELNGFDLTSQESPRGGKFTVRGLSGWMSATQRRDRQAKSQQSGSWDSTGYTDALPISVSGTATYPTAEAAALERRDLVALGGTGRADLTVVDAAGVGTRAVEFDVVDVSPVNERMIAWSFTVTACDPLLYGVSAFEQTGLSSVSGGSGLTYPLTYPLTYGAVAGVTPGVVSVSNDGSASYHPRLRIDGPVTNPVVTLSETGDRLAYAGTITAGQWLDVDCARRRVLLNGQLSMRHRMSFVGAWLAVPVGGGSLTWTADSATTASSLSVWSYEGAWL